VTERDPDKTVSPDGGWFAPYAAWLRHYTPWLRRSVPLWVLITAGVVIGLAGAVFVTAGGVNVSADRADGPVVGGLLHFVFKRSEGAAATSVAPPPDLASPDRVRLAAQHFDMVCSNCHGRPGAGQSVIALSMNPRPQYLPKVVGQFTDPELFEIVEHGVKYSAMPSWPTSSRDDEVWSMVAFLRQLPKLDLKTYNEMTALPKTADAALARGDGDTTLRPANRWRDTPPVDEFSYAAPASGFSDQSFAGNPAATCARCHGADGSGAATGGEAPNLTIQAPAYLQAALQAYTRGARKSGFMQNIAAQLSGAQITAISTYYAGLPVKTVASPPADPALVKRGEQIATQGIRERAAPACAVCHESAGAQVIGAPHIAGQSATYLRRELGAMRLGGRGATVSWNPMPAEAHQLDDHDIAAVAAYYSGLQPTKTAGGGQAPQSGQALPIPAGTTTDMAAAKAIFETRCVKCHTNQGRGDRAGGFPDLTLQTAPYVAQTLYSFRTRARPNAQMRETIDSLSFDDMSSLARYIDGLAPQPALLKPQADAAAAARGAAIATYGIPGRGVPACLSCHGAKSVAALPLIPRLQGQSPLYLRNRLNHFAEPYKVNLTALNPMPAIASRLTDQERADLAAYFAAAAPLAKPAARH
jgi:cytochrome c553